MNLQPSSGTDSWRQGPNQTSDSLATLRVDVNLLIFQNLPENGHVKGGGADGAAFLLRSLATSGLLVLQLVPASVRLHANVGAKPFQSRLSSPDPLSPATLLFLQQ